MSLNLNVLFQLLYLLIVFTDFMFYKEIKKVNQQTTCIRNVQYITILGAYRAELTMLGPLYNFGYKEKIYREYVRLREKERENLNAK